MDLSGVAGLDDEADLVAGTGVAGLELGSGVQLNSVAPERAAAELRDC